MPPFQGNSDLSPATRAHVTREQLRLVFAAAPAGIIATLLAGLLVGFALYPAINTTMFTVWYLSLVFALAYRAVIYTVWRAHADTLSPSRTVSLVLLGFACTGAVWGALPIWLFPPHQFGEQFFVILAIIGMSAGAVTSVAVLRHAAVSYVLPMLIPLAWRLFSEDAVNYKLIGVAVLLIGVIFFNNAKRALHSVEEALVARMRSEQAEKRANSSEQRYRTLIEHAADAVFLHDLEGRILDVDSQASLSLGYTREELVNRNLCDIETGDTVEDRRAFWRALELEKRVVVEGRQRRKDGSEFPVERVLVAFNLQGAVQILAVTRDISERKKMLATLQLREEQARALFKGIPLPTYTWKYVDGDFTLVEYNDAANAYSQGHIAKMAGVSLAGLYADNRLAQELVWQCFNTRKNIHRELPFTFAHNGYTAHLSMHIAFVPPDIVMVHTDDISQRIEYERELRESRAKLEYAQRIAHMGSWEWDIASGRIEWSGEIYRILGLDSQTMPAQDAFARAMHPDDVSLLEASFERGMAGEREFDEEWRMVAADTGRTKYVHLQGERFFDAQGALVGMKGTLHDITERKQVELAKSEFISTVSHELRTPLTSIYGALRLLSAGVGMSDRAQLDSMLALALRNADQLAALVNDILDLSHIEQGRFVVAPVPVYLADVIRQAVELNRGFGQHYSVEFALTLPSVPLIVNADAARITQVVSNLLSNAVKYSIPQSVVEIHVVQRDDRARISIADSGPGISAEFLPRLFARFSRADNSTARSKGGTGLGLSIAKAIIDAHGGHINYTPRPGGGSIFYFELICLTSTEFETANTTQLV